MSIEIQAIRLTNTGSSLRAFVDVKVGTWIINDWRVWQQNGRAYVSVPQSSWKDPSGQIKFKPILTIPDDQLQQIQTAILHAYHQEKEKTNGSESK
jgi:DNA-binding cell septation regulator SpoVG